MEGIQLGVTILVAYFSILFLVLIPCFVYYVFFKKKHLSKKIAAEDLFAPEWFKTENREIGTAKDGVEACSLCRYGKVKSVKICLDCVTKLKDNQYYK